MEQAVKQRRGLLKRLWSFLQKYGALCLVLFTVTGVCFLFSCRKSGMFIDEIYTYGLSNSHAGPYVRDAAGGSLKDAVLTRQDLFSYMTVDEGEGFDFGAVVYNQTQDVHPPLYYWLFNMASSLTPGVLSKWTGLVLDYLIYLCALWLLYLLSVRLFGSRAVGAAAAALYGLSVIGLSTMLMIRMYVLLTALTVLLAWLTAGLLESRRLWYCPLIGLCIFLGLMTQYYYVFYAFFLCGFVVLALLFQREFKMAGVFSLCAFAGVGLLVAAFPGCLDHLFADALVSGGNALENLGDVGQYAGRMLIFLRDTGHRMKGAAAVALLAAAGLVLGCRRLAAVIRDRRVSLLPLLVILPAFPAFVLVALISPVSEIRYIYNIIPLFILAVCYLLMLLERCTDTLPHPRARKAGMVLLVLAVSLWYARCLPPDYLYPEHREYNAAVAAHGEDPCLYLTGYVAPITQDLLQLLAFEDVFVTESPASPALDRYLEDRGSPEECVVFIDISSFWSSGFDPAEMLPQLLSETYFTSYERLYQYGLSDTYLLTVD